MGILLSKKTIRHLGPRVQDLWPTRPVNDKLGFKTSIQFFFFFFWGFSVLLNFFSKLIGPLFEIIFDIIFYRYINQLYNITSVFWQIDIDYFFFSFFNSSYLQNFKIIYKMIKFHVFYILKLYLKIEFINQIWNNI